jgi:bifunctional non-homologous end joining protein LigD
MAHVDGGIVKLISRSGEEVTPRYPEIHAMGRALGSRQVILDGEVVALDEQGRPSFEQIQQRMGITSETDIRRTMKVVPVTYMIFDLIWEDGHSLFGVGYAERRRRLAALKLSGASWQTPPFEKGGGQAMLDASAGAGLEGVLGKKLDSHYEPGLRSGVWVKIKNHRSQDLVIAGWTEGEGRRRGYPGALLVGYYDQGSRVRRKGRNRFSDAMLEKLTEMMMPLAPDKSLRLSASPRKGPLTEPRSWREFEFVEWTCAGQLRAPSFQRLRNGTPPSKVVREGG